MVRTVRSMLLIIVHRWLIRHDVHDFRADIHATISIVTDIRDALKVLLPRLEAEIGLLLQPSLEHEL